jgi:ATP-dependent Clp protease adapter protein ClpS
MFLVNNMLPKQTKDATVIDRRSVVRCDDDGTLLDLVVLLLVIVAATTNPAAVEVMMGDGSL